MKLDITNVFPFVSRDTIYKYESDAMKQQEALHEGTGAGNDFLGWLELPGTISEDLISDIETTAAAMRDKLDAVVLWRIVTGKPADYQNGFKNHLAFFRFFMSSVFLHLG